MEVKLVFSRSAAVVSSERVPPTICFTEPAWRSMQGRKRVILVLNFLFFPRGWK